MRKLTLAMLAGTATLFAAGTAYAAAEKYHTMHVSMPNGSIAQISYVGDVAPTIVAVPAVEDFMPMDSLFAEFDRISAMMDLQMQAMMQHVAEMQLDADQGAAPVTTMTSGNLPAGTVQYSYVSTTTSNGNCTQTVEWQSDGSQREPQVIRTSSGACDSMKSAPQQPVTASAPQPAEEPAIGLKT